jgi:hypothetical protein
MAATRSWWLAKGRFPSQLQRVQRTLGKYTEEMELESASADDPPHRRDWRDD